MDDSTNGETQSAAPAEEKQPDRLAHPVGTEQRPRLDFPVVGIGASAGGLEAFIEFFEAMPSDAGIAFVLVQHLSPDRESMVSEILSKHTPMPVAQVEEHMAVQPNHVYVIRPGRTLTIKNGRLHLGAPLKDPGHNRPVDDFFRSLAEEQRERSIGIILSGMGSNGTAGAEAIKAVGGLLIAQDPESAKFPSMPRMLIDSGNADFIIRPREMPERLLRYAAHPYVRGEQLAEAATRRVQALEEIIAVVRARTRRDFTGYKKPTVIRRIERRMGLHQIEALGDYATFLRQSSGEALALADDLMINVTGFFRDPEAWQTLSEKVIAPLVRERDAESEIRCWVTACSSGEEAYTLAMLLTEEAERQGKLFDIKVFATDSAERSLAKARDGAYPLGIEGELSPDRLDRFFDRDEVSYRVRADLRERVVFAPQNVIQDPPFSRLDIATCRNLLIYLEPELQRRILGLLHFGLRQGGALLLGSSETVAGVENLFEVLDKRARIYRRIGPLRHESVDFAFPRAKAGESRALPAATVERAAPRLTVAQQTQRTLLERFTPPSVTVDRHYRVVYFHGDTTPYLNQPPGEPTRDLMALVREEHRGAARTALHQAMTEERFACLRDGIVEDKDGRFRLEITATPLAGGGDAGLYLVSFVRGPELLPSPAEGEPGASDADELRYELRRTKEDLQSAVEELQGTNEEMRASHEEAMSVNEELQSTNEELETSKEELQSLNEELTTVNAQLQHKADEHETVVSDLNSLLSSTNVAVIFLDPQLKIRRYTPAATDLIELIPSDVGRSLSDLHKKFHDDILLADCQAVLERLAPVEREVTSSSSDRVYMRRVQPYRTVDNRIDGVVITFIDVTALNVSQTAQREAEERFRQVIEGAQDFAMLLMDADGKIVTWNFGAERLLGWSKSEAIGKSASMIYVGNDAAAQQAREMEKAARDGRAVDETWHRRKDGSQFWGSGMLTALRDDRGELTGFVKVMRDETARRDAESDRDQLLQSEQKAREAAEQANLVKDQFLARLSHELRTPLSSILTWAEMLQHRDMSDEQLSEGLRVIERSANSQKQLLDDLLDTSRIASGKLRLSHTIVDIRRLTQQVVETLSLAAGEHGVSLELHADEVGQVLADPDRLRQVIINLITNAIKFTPSGGRVDVHLERTDHHLELRVTDTGQGIDAEFLPHIFTPFSQADFTATRSYGGLGLGLAISRELVEMHGGTIRAESAGQGQGSTFIVHLPLATRQQIEQTAIELEPMPGGHADALRGVHILVVEDDAATQLAYVRMLAASGAEVAKASTAEEALAAYSESAPDIILSDVGLPQQDGYELLRRIRERERERGASPTPAIALTAFAGPQHRRQAAAAGFQAHVAKPVRLADLISTITRYTKKPD